MSERVPTKRTIQATRLCERRAARTLLLAEGFPEEAGRLVASDALDEQAVLAAPDRAGQGRRRWIAMAGLTLGFGLTLGAWHELTPVRIGYVASTYHPGGGARRLGSGTYEVEFPSPLWGPELRHPWLELRFDLVSRLHRLAVVNGAASAIERYTLEIRVDGRPARRAEGDFDGPGARVVHRFEQPGVDSVLLTVQEPQSGDRGLDRIRLHLGA